MQTTSRYASRTSASLGEGYSFIALRFGTCNFTSVTVAKEGLEISVSFHFVNPNKMKNKLMEFERAYTKETLLPNSSEMRLTEHQSDVPDLLPTQGNNVSSVAKIRKVLITNKEAALKIKKPMQFLLMKR